MDVFLPRQAYDNDFAPRPEDVIAPPPVVRNVYTLRQWWRSLDGMGLIWFDAEGIDRIREFGLRWYVGVYRWGTLFRLVRVRGKVAESWRYLKNTLWHRYNTIVARDLPPTWCDRDTLLLHVMFAVLVEYVEKEEPFNHFETSANYDTWYAIRDLYVWWTVRRPARIEAERAALNDWHDEFQARGGLTSEPSGPHLSRMVFPDDRGEDVERLNRLRDTREALEAAGEAEDDAMMIRLIRLRGHLWT